MQRHIRLSLFTLWITGVTWGQTTAAIVSVGPSAQPIARVAPGQILRLRFSGVTTPFRATPAASGLPLPTNLEGLGVKLRMAGRPDELPLPLIRGGGYGACTSPVALFFMPPSQVLPCTSTDTYTEFLVQVPFELPPNLPGNDRCVSVSPTLPVPPCTPVGLKDALFTVVEPSGTGRSLRVLALVDQIHVLTSCDYSPVNEDERVGVFGKPAFCEPIMTHPDSSTVTAERPGVAGEMLAAYAYGLGLPEGKVETGAATPAGGLRVPRPINLSFPGVAAPDSVADYAGLVEGFVSLYQINFRVPALPAGLAQCSQTRASNISMILEGTSSRDQIGFCVRAE